MQIQVTLGQVQAQVQEQNQAFQVVLGQVQAQVQDLNNSVLRSSAQNYNSSSLVPSHGLREVPSRDGRLPGSQQLWSPNSRSELDYETGLTTQRANALLLFYGIALPVGPGSKARKRQLLAAELGVRL
jgi:hypothetical protein